MVAEDKLSWEREKEDRFGRSTSSMLATIVEVEESDDEGEGESKGKGSFQLNTVAVLPVPPPPSDPIPPPTLATSSPPEPPPPLMAKKAEVDAPATVTRRPHPGPSKASLAPSPSISASSTTAHHEGQLLKQSGLLGLWKHKYFVLDNDILKYYKHEKDKLDNNGLCKIFVLSSSTVLAYAKLSLVFKVVNEETGGEELCLMASSKEALEGWITALKAAISRKYSQMKRRSINMKKGGG
jgi:hypothetical protein